MREVITDVFACVGVAAERLEDAHDRMIDRLIEASPRARAGIATGGSALIATGVLLRTLGLEAEGVVLQVAGVSSASYAVGPGALRSVGVLPPQE